jgi:hypothetical protein
VLDGTQRILHSNQHLDIDERQHAHLSLMPYRPLQPPRSEMVRPCPPYPLNLKSQNAPGVGVLTALLKVLVRSYCV